MKILVIGNGAREHAICWALRKSKKCKKLFCIPGNAGIENIASCYKTTINKKKILDFCKNNSVDLVVIGPEQYLESGLSDYLLKKGLKVFGPSKRASKLESSKSYAKKFLEQNKIPSEKYKEFRDFEKAKNYIFKTKFPLVIKADGLASGKGVLICKNKKEAFDGLKKIMVQKKFGTAGKKIIIEEFLEGFELSFFVFFDKNSYSILDYALDHKRANDYDKGPNTGGMGCFTPSSKVTNSLKKKIIDQIVVKTYLGLKKRKITYRGILFFGLMVNKLGPHVIEYNVRFGDPECQTLLRKLKSDLLEIFIAVNDDKLSKIKIKVEKKSSLCVILASKGYPGKYKTDKIIKNIEKAKSIKDIEIFHAGTKSQKNKILSSGGRVLSITSVGDTISIARKKAYKALKKINWKSGFFRTDIGEKNI